MVMTSKPLPTFQDDDNNAGANEMGTPVPEGRKSSNQQQQGQQQLQRAPSKALTTTSKGSEAPVFMAQPKPSMKLSTHRGSTVQQQVYRMNGGIHPTDLLSSRLSAWRLAIKDLIKLFQQIEGIESRTAGRYSKSSKTIVIPLPEANGQFMESGGIQDLWMSFRNYTVEQSVRHQDYVNYLDRSVLPSLRSIKNDIKSMLKAIGHDKNLKTTSLYEGRRRMDALVSKLDSAIQYNTQMPDSAHQRQDPLLINCAVFQANKNLFDSENTLHENILNLQHEIHLFERNLVESIRSITHQLQQFRMEKLEAHSAFGQVTTTFGNIGADTEWDEFARRNSGNLISTEAAYKTDQDISYPNQNHDLVQPVKVGLLERRTSIMRNWAEGLYVLTPSGFLHSYKSTRQFDEDPLSPEVSIFIPHTNIDCSRNYDSMYQENAFEIRGKNAQSLVGMEKSFMLRSQDQNDLQDWFNRLVQMSDRFRPEPLIQQGQFGQQQQQQQQQQHDDDDDDDYDHDQQQGGYEQQQQGSERALPPMPEEQEPSSSGYQQQGQQNNQQQQQQQPQVIQVPVEYIQPQQAVATPQVDQSDKTQQASQVESDETHQQDKGKSPIPVAKSSNTGNAYQQDQVDDDDDDDDDDDWDTVPQQDGNAETALQRD
ncbi:hypothetical protein BDB00DRAFT_382561 [Zychaea mexicana]|uniref:uncharacterized protein n=1 Tax=Zychaea mexicana TaxID=64656 RepID=UPI0022FF07B1|nr:uncharacterized protein BDB00DRAFT_382561 [Zychaea mexicana]KAI9493278.1 hypothetical protein BDB00DRAFT_382561 [Zychaea mexicana]